MMFSIIAIDYDGSISRERRQAFIESLQKQSFKDFEVILLHDGRRSEVLDIDTTGLNIRFEDTLFRANCWGHNLRTLGMKLASGHFIINTNADNLYYPNALEDLNNFILQHPETNIIVNHVRMMGLNHDTVTQRIWYDTPRDYSKNFILTGNPVRLGNIDLMNLVASRKVWESINYWYNLNEASDGIIYQHMCSIYPHLNSKILLGEHY